MFIVPILITNRRRFSISSKCLTHHDIILHTTLFYFVTYLIIEKEECMF